jgi:hypothetical protein
VNKSEPNQKEKEDHLTTIIVQAVIVVVVTV